MHACVYMCVRVHERGRVGFCLCMCVRVFSSYSRVGSPQTAPATHVLHQVCRATCVPHPPLTLKPRPKPQPRPWPHSTHFGKRFMNVIEFTTRLASSSTRSYVATWLSCAATVRLSSAMVIRPSAPTCAIRVRVRVRVSNGGSKDCLWFGSPRSGLAPLRCLHPAPLGAAASTGQRLQG